MNCLSPRNIESITGYFLDGEVNGEEYREAEFEHIVEPFDLVHEPIYRVVTSDNYEENNTFGSYASRIDRKKDREHNQEYEDLTKGWLRNQEADFYALLLDNDGNELRVDFGGRNDSDPSQLMYPFSIMEGISRPNGDSPYDERQKIGLRVARDYDEGVYQDANVPANFDNLENMRNASEIADLQEGVMLNEIDLMTAYDREDGVYEELTDSDIPFSRLIRNDYRILEEGSETSFSRASSAVPYFFRWLPNDLQSAGISMEEAELAGRHIGTCNALGLSFRYDRAPVELMTESVNREEHLVNIDPETVRYTSRESSLNDDFHHFQQQFDQMAKPFWREKDIRMKEVRDNILDQAPEEMMLLVSQNLPNEWSDEMPDERILQKRF